jgi:predicted nucleic acid-binding protein
VTEKNFLADTSFLIDLEESRPEAVKKIQENNVFTGYISVYELKKLSANKGIEEVSEGKIHDFTREDAEKASEIHRRKSDEEENIKAVDCLIAAQAINRDLPLLTADTDFRKIEGLETEYYRETQ